MKSCATCKRMISDQDNKIVYNGIGSEFCSDSCFASFLVAKKKQEDLDALYKTIKRIFNISKVENKIFLQIDQLCKNEGLTYKSINATLHYMYDIEGRPVYSPTLYYVKDYIEPAKKYYQELKEREARAIVDIEKAKPLPTQIVRPNYNKKRSSGLKIDPSMV